MPGAGTPGSSVAVGAALPLEAAAAPAAGLGALRLLLVLQSFAPARGRAASLEAARYRRASQAAINGGVWADRREPPLGPPRGLIDTSGALIHVSRDGFGHRDGVALVAPSASYMALGDAVAARLRLHKAAPTTPKVHDSVAGSLLRAAVAPH